MKKATALTLAGLMAITAASNATMSRINGFGESGKFVADNTDMWTWPSVVANNADTTYLEFGKNAVNPRLNNAVSYLAYGNGVAGAANAWGGNNMTLGPGVLGIWYNRPFTKQSNELGSGLVAVGMGGASMTSNPGLPQAGVNGAVTGLLGFATPQNQIDLVYGFNVGGAALGVGINRATNSNKVENAVNAGTNVLANNADAFGISLGAGLKDLGAVKELNLGLQYDSLGREVNGKDAANTFDDKITETSSEINLRVGADLSGNIIDLNVNTEGRNTKTASKTAPAADSYVELKESAMDINLGWAMTKSSDKGMGLGGLILDSKTQSRDAMNSATPKVNDKLDVSTLKIDAVCGSEFKAKDWLTVRTGLSGTLFKSTTTTLDQTNTGTSTTNKNTVSSSTGAPAVISLGTSLILGDVVVDAIANQDFLYSGPYFISGVPNGLNLAVSATMKWGGAKE